MKVSNSPTPQPQSLEKAIAPVKTTPPATTEKSLADNDLKKPSEVAISEDAKLMRKASELAHSAPNVRQDRIDSLKKQIAEGKYSVQSSLVADRLVDEHVLNDFGKNRL